MLKYTLSRRQFCKASGVIIAAGLFSDFLFTEASAETSLQFQAEQALNNIRREYNLPLLKLDAKLEKAAIYQAQRMADANKMSHSVGWLNSFGARVKKAGIRGPAAENLAVGQQDIATVMQMWMQSKGHRMNLLDKIFDAYGLAVAAPAANPRRKYWALILGVDQNAF